MSISSAFETRWVFFVLHDTLGPGPKQLLLPSVWCVCLNSWIGYQEFDSIYFPNSEKFFIILQKPSLLCALFPSSSKTCLVDRSDSWFLRINVYHTEHLSKSCHRQTLLPLFQIMGYWLFPLFLELLAILLSPGIWALSISLLLLTFFSYIEHSLILSSVSPLVSWRYAFTFSWLNIVSFFLALTYS